MNDPIEIYMAGWRSGAAGQKLESPPNQEIEQVRLRGYVDGAEAARRALQLERSQARVARGGEVTVEQALAVKRRLG
jgi:hypothetical protein